MEGLDIQSLVQLVWKTLGQVKANKGRLDTAKAALQQDKNLEQIVQQKRAELAAILKVADLLKPYFDARLEVSSSFFF